MRIAHLSDLHVGKTDAEWPATLELLDKLRSVAFDVLVVSGDLIDPPDKRELLAKVHHELEALGRPYVVVPGNHDVRTPGFNDVFERFFGPYPRVERVAGAAFLLFDSFGGLPVQERSVDDQECFANSGCWGDGRIPTSQFELMESALTEDDTIRLAVVHHHLDPTPDEKVNALLNADELVAWCGRNGISHVFVGHWHEASPAAQIGTVTRLRIGRSTKPPIAFGVLDLDTGEYVIDSGEAAGAW